MGGWVGAVLIGTHTPWASWERFESLKLILVLLIDWAARDVVVDDERVDEPCDRAEGGVDLVVRLGSNIH